MSRAVKQPNVVLILGDYMGYGDIGPTGVTDIATPHLDELARDGILFTDVCAAASICSPSRAAILTGRMPARIGLVFLSILDICRFASAGDMGSLQKS